MLKSLTKLLIINLIFFSSTFLPVFSESIKKIVITGNERISDSTIEMFSSTAINDDLDSNKLNSIIKSL